MFSDLASIRTAVKERLAPLLPEKWKWETTVAETAEKSLVPVVYVEFTGIESAPDGTPLGRGTAGARFNIIVADNKTGEQGESATDEHVLRIVAAIEHTDDLYWSTATKARFPDGRLYWAITVLALALTPNPEPPSGNA